MNYDSRQFLLKKSRTVSPITTVWADRAAVKTNFIDKDQRFRGYDSTITTRIKINYARSWYALQLTFISAAYSQLFTSTFFYEIIKCSSRFLISCLFSASHLVQSVSWRQIQLRVPCKDEWLWASCIQPFHCWRLCFWAKVMHFLLCLMHNTINWHHQCNWNVISVYIFW